MGVGAKFAVGVVAVAALVGVGFATKCFLGGECGSKHKSAQEAQKLAVDIVKVAREGSQSELRGWLISHTPAAVEQVLLQIDNSIDPASRSRLVILGAIYSLGSEGLTTEATAEWAGALRHVSEGLLHAGPERADYFAKSYLMQGDRARAAVEYGRYPEHPGAQLFFKQYPELKRVPASN